VRFFSDPFADSLHYSLSRVDLVLRYGIPCVADFGALRMIVEKSVSTLKQLGSSQYSSAMRPQLLEWYKTVTEAGEAVETLEKVQMKWLRQEVLLTSMTLEEHVPLSTSLFAQIRAKIAKAFQRLRQEESLVAAFKNSFLIQDFSDLSLALDETETAMHSALWALRISSPGLFFLSDRELVDLMDASHRDIQRAEYYIGKILPWFKSLILDDEVSCEVNRQAP